MRRRSSVPPDLRFTSLPLLLILALLSVEHRVEASIHEYKNEAFIPRYNSFFFHGGSEGMYASRVHESKEVEEEKPLYGKSFIRFESITFRRPKEVAAKQNEMQQKTGLVEAIILAVRDRDKIGGSTTNPEAICCNPELSKQGLCKLGEVIIRHDPDTPEWPNRIQTFFEGKNEETTMDIKVVEINSTGMYYLYFMYCDPELKGTIISGKTIWRNPDGYLPGKMAPMMTFYGFMCLAYLVLGLAWFVQFVKYWKDIIQLHYHITAVIGLGMCEMAFWYFEYVNFNSTGYRPMGITLCAVTFSDVKKLQVELQYFNEYAGILCITVRVYSIFITKYFIPNLIRSWNCNTKFQVKLEEEEKKYMLEHLKQYLKKQVQQQQELQCHWFG